jgi:hypothetical protein
VGESEDAPTGDRDAVNPDTEEMDEIDTPEEAEALVEAEAKEDTK